MSTLLRAATAGHDLTQTGADLLHYVQTHDDPYALLDLALVLEMKFERDAALAVHHQALHLRRHYTVKHTPAGSTPHKLLVLKAPGDLMANTPFECLTEGADFQIDVLYVDGYSTPDRVLPEHDLVFVAACASDANTAALANIDTLTQHTQRRVLNRPEHVLKTTRDAAYALLGDAPGICMAATMRFSREQLREVVSGRASLPALLDGQYPLIIRPAHAHAGHGLGKVADVHALAAYLDQSDEPDFFVAPFIDYSDADGLFRKYRIVMIEGRAYLCHMGISTHWVVHYPYPEMVAHASRRDEEASAMASFDTDFARRHAEPFRHIFERTGLDYVGFDCAETADGRLLIFEIATGMVVHDMDDPETYPYKLPQIREVSKAFQAMLRGTSGRASALASINPETKAA
jgi:hypothetical protein